MPQIRILAVGKIKTSFWQQAIEHYTKRIAYGYELSMNIVKDADSALPMAKRIETEAERIKKFLSPNDVIICLDEKGKSLTSRDFATFLQSVWERGKTPCFIIGGAFGLSADIKQEAAHLLCLGAMTLPHELARVVLCEQLYRAGTILSGTGYHH